MIYSAGKRKDLPLNLLEEIGRYRHRVFVGHLGWPMCVSADVESDEFDNSNAIYVFSRSQRGWINGFARLLPTTDSYLLKKVFHELWGKGDFPNSIEIWELSRFAALDFDAIPSPAEQNLTGNARNLFQYTTQIAKEHGARTLVTVSPVEIERLLHMNRFCVSRAGIPKKYGRENLVALSIDLNF
ncbi:MAG: N-acylhomoserine lactone synthase [Burkholderiaceae bacterium]|jgi:N-acyl-L-homoserine lactone synthetase|nr:N-acylhomoserine lactone synthase [Burkholderiaceae bacterium]